MGVVINCDMGEGFGLYRCGDDEGIMPHIHIANVACGFHASDPVVMRRTVRLAAEHGVAVGAHPSFPDLQGFGRREMVMGRDELSACLLYQIGALKAFLDVAGLPLNHIKPHGALYGAATRHEHVAHAIADAAETYGVPVLGMAGTLHETVYRERGLPFMAEYYVDLDYDASGKLIITREHDAKDPAEAARRAVRVMTEGKATAIDGSDVPMRCDCVCVHSDTPGAVELARAVNEALRPYFA
ncbi:LamB/YcsF family protein [Aureimonas endophytica]|uniref:LamB/YcsF family protein n=1 Tax=Aureimonas endophytica TaxID=2027858 RepID=A0A916ZIX9_9HYPH|nr:LamB/YcsF family protein [Aureimonas endophytica]GGD98798.1 LamB/YcsF family protein [Aureimonas endophytica]